MKKVILTLAIAIFSFNGQTQGIALDFSKLDGIFGAFELVQDLKEDPGAIERLKVLKASKREDAVGKWQRENYTPAGKGYVGAKLIENNQLTVTSYTELGIIDDEVTIDPGFSATHSVNVEYSRRKVIVSVLGFTGTQYTQRIFRLNRDDNKPQFRLFRHNSFHSQVYFGAQESRLQFIHRGWVLTGNVKWVSQSGRNHLAWIGTHDI